MKTKIVMMMITVNVDNVGVIMSSALLVLFEVSVVTAVTGAEVTGGSAVNYNMC